MYFPTICPHIQPSKGTLLGAKGIATNGAARTQRTLEPESLDPLFVPPPVTRARLAQASGVDGQEQGQRHGEGVGKGHSRHHQATEAT